MGKALGSVFSTGKSSAKKERRLMEDQARIAQEMAEQQKNVAQAQASLAEEQMFSGAEEGLGIEGIDTESVGGKRKRRQQQTGSGLGI